MLSNKTATMLMCVGLYVMGFTLIADLVAPSHGFRTWMAMMLAAVLAIVVSSFGNWRDERTGM